MVGPLVYADTGVLCSLYAPDAHTAMAAKRFESLSGVVAYTWLHQLELRNALRLRVFRWEITPAQRDGSLHLLLEDLASGVLQHTTLNNETVGFEAERLSVGHTETLGVRSLDILHVAAALVLGVETFWSFDARQAALAKAVGLKVA